MQPVDVVPGTYYQHQQSMRHQHRPHPLHHPDGPPSAAAFLGSHHAHQRFVGAAQYPVGGEGLAARQQQQQQSQQHWPPLPHTHPAPGMFVSPPPPPPPPPPQSPHRPPHHAHNWSLYKTELCRSFSETGYCRYGAKCQFAHGLEDLRPVVRHRRWKTEKCKNFEKDGVCPYGSRCDFIHNEDLATLAATKRTGQYMTTPRSAPGPQPRSPGFQTCHPPQPVVVFLPPPMRMPIPVLSSGRYPQQQQQQQQQAPSPLPPPLSQPLPPSPAAQTAASSPPCLDALQEQSANLAPLPGESQLSSHSSSPASTQSSLCSSAEEVPSLSPVLIGAAAASPSSVSRSLADSALVGAASSSKRFRLPIFERLAINPDAKSASASASVASDTASESDGVARDDEASALPDIVAGVEAGEVGCEEQQVTS